MRTEPPTPPCTELSAQIKELLSNGQYAAAERLAQEGLLRNAAEEDLLFLLVQALYLQTKLDNAIETMERLLTLNHMSALYHTNYAAMLAKQKRWAESENACRMALAFDKTNRDAYFNLAITLFRQQERLSALETLDELHKIAPDFSDAYALRGEILETEKRLPEAVSALCEAINLGNETPEVFMRLGFILESPDQETPLFDIVSNRLSGRLGAPFYFALGNQARAQGQLAKAAALFREAIALNPTMVEAFNNLGLTLKESGDLQGSEDAMREAIRIDPTFSAAHINIGNHYTLQGNMTASINCLEKACELDPNAVEGLNNLAQAYCRVQRLEEAKALLYHALALAPQHSGVRLNLGIVLLLQGHLEEAWPYFEARWEASALCGTRPAVEQPEWTGQPLDSKAILIYAEQGLGDNLQFVRYLGVLRERYPKAQIYHATRPPLFRLFAEYAAYCDVNLSTMNMLGGLPPIDYHVALMSIPGCLHTSLATIPATVPYLIPPSDLIEKWGRRLDQCLGKGGKRVGLVWASGETYTFHKARTLHLKQLQPLLGVTGIQWISLQKGSAVAQIVAEGVSATLLNLMDEAEDFADTAAIMFHLDLLISVDTSVPHLAGAMGKPVWLLDRFDTDWRWLLDREDNPWYPTLRIFRQHAFGDWDPVISRATAALREWVETPTTTLSLPKAFPRTTQDIPASFGSSQLKYQLVAARHGWMLANTDDLWIGRALIEYGEYSEYESRFLLACLIKKGMIVEAGANMGSHTIGLAKRAAERGEMMEVFEPQPVVFQQLCANLALNGLTNVRAWPFACADTTGVVHFAPPNYHTQGNFGGVTMSTESSENSISVPCVRLDDMLANKKVALLKVDVEGFELATLKGAQQTLQRDRPLLYVENDRKENAGALIEWLWQQSYRLYWHYPPLFNEDNYFARTYNRYPNKISRNMLCVPRELDLPLPNLPEITVLPEYP